MGLTSYDAAVLANANLVAYWDLNGNTNDTKGTNHMSGGTAGTYVAGIDGSQAMQFNGTSQGISSASTIDLTLTNKTTLVGFLKFNFYDLTNQAMIFESSTAAGANNGTMQFSSYGPGAGDPIVSLCRGDIGNNQASYNQTSFGWATGIWYHFAITYDFSQAVNEVQTYLNGNLLTADSRITNNNTGNFGNFTLYLGARNNGASLFFNGVLCKVALFNADLGAAGILGLYKVSQLGLNSRQRGSLKLRNSNILKID